MIVCSLSQDSQLVSMHKKGGTGIYCIYEIYCALNEPVQVSRALLICAYMYMYRHSSWLEGLLHSYDRGKVWEAKIFKNQ